MRVVDRADVARRVDGDGERSLVARKCERGEGKVARVDGMAGRGAERRRDRGVIERGLLLECGRVDDHEGRAAGDRLAIPEAARVPDPRRRVDGIHDQAIETLVDGLRALIVGRLALSDGSSTWRDRRGNDEKGDPTVATDDRH
jgi:hypothetical protein